MTIYYFFYKEEGITAMILDRNVVKRDGEQRHQGEEEKRKNESYKERNVL